MDAPLQAIQSKLVAAEQRADEIIRRAERSATTLSEEAARLDREFAGVRLARIARLRDEIRSDQKTIDASTVRMVELLAQMSERLMQDARDADFSPPAWPDGLGRVVEIKFSETREVTFRVGAGRPPIAPRRRPF